MTALDRHARPLGTLRLSVTDRCNLRCAYCMPEPDYTWLARSDLLSFEELREVAVAFAGLGVDRIRLTGGEPTLRADLPVLVGLLRSVGGLRELALTTNGTLLHDLARPLSAAGLSRVTVSLDTLSRERFQALTRRDEHRRVLDGIEAAIEAGFSGLKLDTVLQRGVNDDEVGALLGFARERGAELRFIEYMDVGGATRWARDRVVTRRELLSRVAAELGPVEALPRVDAAPAERFRLSSGQTFGIIASVSEPFCATCDRARLTADGTLLTCLYATRGVDLRGILRGPQPETLQATIASVWRARTDRGAEQRAGLGEARAPLVQLPALRRDPHLEMHTRGG